MMMHKHTINIQGDIQKDTFEVVVSISDAAKALLDYWMVEDFEDYEFDLRAGTIRARKELVHHLV